MAQHELCYRLHELEYENRDRIHQALLEMHPNKMKTHDEWLTLVNELEDRVNWLMNLSVMCDRSYFNDRFDVKDVRLSLDDYVYNQQSIRE